jgi:N-acetylglucosaminyl-diphospho-decaprenol L-rhamnosyltransferase
MAPGLTTIVVDNGSTDRTLEQVRRRPGVHLIANTENRGFAAGANQGFQAAEADVVLLMNPDVRLSTPLDQMVEACWERGLAAGQLTDSTGNPQSSYAPRRFPSPAALALELLGINYVLPSNSVNRRYRYLDRNLSEAGEVDQPAGAFLMVRRDVWERLGGLDESFHPVWFEDVDFCLRAHQAGLRIEYLPQVQAQHTGGESIKKIDDTRREVYWYDSLLRYAAKHSGPLAYRLVCLAAILSSVPRTVAGMIRERSLRPLTSCYKIIHLAGRRLIGPPRLTPLSGRNS